VGHLDSPARRRDSKRDPYRTLEVVRSPDAFRASRTFRRNRWTGPILGYAVAAGAGALLVALGVRIGSLVRSPEFAGRRAPLRTAILTASSSSGKAVAIGGNSPASPRPVPAVVDAGPAQSDTATHRRVAKPKPGRSRLPAVAMPEGGVSPIRHCARVDETPFHAAALDQVGGRALRSDAEFMRMKISVPEVAAADGHPAVASVFFENGGDSSVLLDRLEVTSAKGELRPVSGAMVPVRVPAGGLKEIYRFPLTLSRGETETRQFVVADRDGDQWGATLRLVPCEN
jgi:hypothetical protein